MANGMELSRTLLEPGAFVSGCNYWASHAGTAMWSDWQPEAVKADLQQLAREGMQVLRVFPLWPDFQPLTLLRTGAGDPAEFRMGEAPLGNDEFGRAGVSAAAMQEFQQFADLSDEAGLKLIVGLVTGWMSGRLFVPQALEGRNVLTDPAALLWETRLVRCFVKHFKDHPAILAWDLGNECNCTARVTRPEAWAWTSALSNAIRVEDPKRAIVSGMHSLSPARNAPWTMQDQGELTDLLTTHPYPIFTPHCDRDPLNTIRGLLHATAESRFYADIGGKPCLAEEVGTLGPFVCSEQVAADYIRTLLFSLWANDCHGLLWWCAYDQKHLENAPYDWHSYERELGLVRKDRTVKPVMKEMARFAKWLRELPLRRLPLRAAEAVCVLTHGQDQWAAGFASFILAKQAGFDIEFQYAEQPLKEARLYLLPSLCGAESFTRRFWLELLARVEAGASVYVSHHDCILVPFCEEFGLEVRTRERRSGPARIRMRTTGGHGRVTSYEGASPFRLKLRAVKAEVLAAEEDGNPAFTCARHGKGRAYFLSVAAELHLSQTPGAYHGKGAAPWWRLYRMMAERLMQERVVRKEHPLVGVTEHELDARRRVVVAINYGPEPVETEVSLCAGWSAAEDWHGQMKGRQWRIGANDAVVGLVEKKR